jgi:hypothetical protein
VTATNLKHRPRDHHPGLLERRYPKKFDTTLLLRLAFLDAMRKNVASSFAT